MRILVDEDLPRALAILLRDLGHRADHVSDLGLNGRPDSEIFSAAQTNGAALLTADVAFGDPRRYPRGSHGGIIILRFPDHFRREEILAMFRRFADRVDLNSLPGTLTVVEPGICRIRRS